MPTYYSTLGYEGYDPDEDETGMEGITLAEKIIRRRGFPGDDLVEFTAPTILDPNSLRKAAQFILTPVSRKRGRKATLTELQARVTRLKELGAPVHDDYLSFNRTALLKYTNYIQQKVLRSADKYCEGIRTQMARPPSPLDEL